MEWRSLCAILIFLPCSELLILEAAPLLCTLIVHLKIYTFDPAFYICPLAVRKARFVGASPMALKWAQPCT